MSLVSMFEDHDGKKHHLEEIDLFNYVELVKNGEWSIDVMEYRRTGNQSDKYKMGGITPAGVFPVGRKEDKQKSYSKFAQIDLDDDHEANKDLDFNLLRSQLEAWEYSSVVYTSVGGGGIVVFIKIDTKDFKRCWDALKEYFITNFKVVPCSNGKSPSSMRCHSFDPECYINKRSVKWTQTKKKEKKLSNLVLGDYDLEQAVYEIEERQIDITQGYWNWYSVAAAIQDYTGGTQQGLDWFKRLSQFHPDYDEERCENKFNSFTSENEDNITIRTLAFMLQEHGIKLVSQKTNTIVRTTQNMLRQVGKSGGSKDVPTAKKNAKKVLLELEELKEEHIDQIQKAIKSFDPEAVKDFEGDPTISLIRDYYNEKGVYYDEITKKSYLGDGEVVTDQIINSDYLYLKGDVDKKVSKNDIYSMIDSKDFPRINAIKDYFKELPPSKGGQMDLLLKAVSFSGGEEGEEWLKRWLYSCYGSMLGYTSSLVLTLVSPEAGFGKTAFFREILPDSLKKYLVVENNIDPKDKDFKIKLSCNILVVMDEIDVKDAKGIKSLISSQTITLRKPFGRINEDYQRMAIFGATSNTMDVMLDNEDNRRIIPLRMLKALDWDIFLSIDLDMLWAEIRDGWRKPPGNAPVDDLKQDEIKKLDKFSEDFRRIDISSEAIEQFIEPCKKPADMLTTIDVISYLRDCTGVVLNKQELAQRLRAKGYELKTRRRGAKTLKLWNCQKEVEDYNII